MPKHKLIVTLLRVFIAEYSAGQTASPATGIETRTDSILKKMTLEEKIEYLGGENDFYIRAIPRLGVPQFKMSDGPIGIRNFGPSTAYPAGIALAASWDVDLARRVGRAWGETRVRAECIFCSARP